MFKVNHKDVIFMVDFEHCSSVFEQLTSQKITSPILIKCSKDFTEEL